MARVEDINQERCVLLLCDRWKAVCEGLHNVNRFIAVHLSRFKGVRVYSTTFSRVESMSENDREDAEANNIRLVSLYNRGIASPTELYKTLNSDPRSVFEPKSHGIDSVTHIIGHAPITAEAAVRMRKMFPESKVVLFYHVLPRDIGWMQDRLPYRVPNDRQLVLLAEKADVVYLVTEKIHWYFASKFRNRATDDVDFRLFVPQCTEEIFRASRAIRPHGLPIGDIMILAIAHGGSGLDDWQGMDLPVLTADKVARALPEARLFVGIGGVKRSMADSTRDKLSNMLPSDHTVDITVHAYDEYTDLVSDLESYSLCVVPSRAEPYGFHGLQALSSGIPTLIADNATLSDLIKRLSLEAEYFLAPVSHGPESVKMDSGFWQEKIVNIVKDMDLAERRALQLRTAIRQDEKTKDTHDDFVSYVLGGIGVRHHAVHLAFRGEFDEAVALNAYRGFNDLLMTTMKQCWRRKHHPLTTDFDVDQLLPPIGLPIDDLIADVTNLIENKDRRIVGVDRETSSFIVYCPTVSSLKDLWAMCDRINAGLIKHVVGSGTTVIEAPLMRRFNLLAADVQTTISGPEYLLYKNQLVKISKRVTPTETVRTADV